MIDIRNVDCFDGLKQMEDCSVNCCVTSPPYYGLRDYGVDGQIGMETTPDEYVAKMVEIFSEVRRVLNDDGTLWLNLGDSYASRPRNRTLQEAIAKTTLMGSTLSQQASLKQINKITGDLKPKDLIGIPWMVAFALRADGWYLRQDIIWAKKNCMPESVTDRCTKSHEYIFMLSKSARYYYDQEAIMEPALYDVDGTGTAARKARVSGNKIQPTEKVNGIRADRWDKMKKEGQCIGMRNRRDVWFISPAQFPEAHFATFPEEIPAICIKAGCPVDGVVLDPFSGAGTTGLVARKLNRKFIGFELNPEYVKMSERRIKNELGMFI
jgi:DNA modification methylase